LDKRELYLLGNVDELGNWKEEKAVKMIKIDKESTMWESDLSLECPVGMTIKYQYFILNTINNKKIKEVLPNNYIRSITAKKPGKYIIVNKKGEIATNLTFAGKEKRSSKKKLSRMFVDTLDPKDFLKNTNDGFKNLNFNFSKNDEFSDYISNLSPEDLLSYENNKANFDECDFDVDESINLSREIDQNISAKDRIIMVTIFLPFSVKKIDMNKNEYEIKQNRKQK